mmetsp:Transcript_50102/g.98682  ORF Transcript_50102/g.98682 Transcript_50102/m.98682 type:complete len:149 (-) Transcript_50102:135-581(-)
MGAGRLTSRDGLPVSNFALPFGVRVSELNGRIDGWVDEIALEFLKFLSYGARISTFFCFLLSQTIEGGKEGNNKSREKKFQHSIESSLTEQRETARGVKHASGCQVAGWFLHLSSMHGQDFFGLRFMLCMSFLSLSLFLAVFLSHAPA